MLENYDEIETEIILDFRDEAALKEFGEDKLDNIKWLLEQETTLKNALIELTTLAINDDWESEDWYNIPTFEEIERYQIDMLLDAIDELLEGIEDQKELDQMLNEYHYRNID